MKNSERIDNIERCILKRQIFCIGRKEFPL